MPRFGWCCSDRVLRFLNPTSAWSYCEICDGLTSPSIARTSGDGATGRIGSPAARAAGGPAVALSAHTATRTHAAASSRGLGMMVPLTVDGWGHACLESPTRSVSPIERSRKRRLRAPGADDRAVADRRPHLDARKARAAHELYDLRLRVAAALGRV